MTIETTPPKQQTIDRIMERLTLVSGRNADEGYDFIDLDTVRRVLDEELAE